MSQSTCKTVLIRLSNCIGMGRWYLLTSTERRKKEHLLFRHMGNAASYSLLDLHRGSHSADPAYPLLEVLGTPQRIKGELSE
jgi:hypothetical protein